MKKRTKEEGIEKGDDRPPTQRILSDVVALEPRDTYV